jgi:hypothetical protein
MTKLTCADTPMGDLTAAMAMATVGREVEETAAALSLIPILAPASRILILALILDLFLDLILIPTHIPAPIPIQTLTRRRPTMRASVPLWPLAHPHDLGLGRFGSIAPSRAAITHT